MRRRDVVLNRLTLGFGRRWFGARFRTGLRICCAQRGLRLRRLDRRRIVLGRRYGRCDLMPRHVRSSAADHRLIVLLATTAAPAASAATTAPAPAPAFVAVAGLSGVLVAGLRLGAEPADVMRFRLRWLAVADFFIATAGDVAGLAR